MTGLLWKRTRYHYLANKRGAQLQTAIGTDRHERNEFWEVCMVWVAQKGICVSHPRLCLAFRYTLPALIDVSFSIVKILMNKSRCSTRNSLAVTRTPFCWNAQLTRTEEEREQEVYEYSENRTILASVWVFFLPLFGRFILPALAPSVRALRARVVLFVSSFGARTIELDIWQRPYTHTQKKKRQKASHNCPYCPTEGSE